MNTQTLRYIRQYQWSNVLAMIRNNRRSPAICPDSCTGKLVVITGATAGIGRETARYYASKGANLLCINRNPEKSEALKQEIEGEFGVLCDYRIADLSRMDDIFGVAGELVQLETGIDILIHNAGVYMTQRELTPEGFEKVFVVHYLSSFIINYLLRDKLKAQKNARILMVGSEGHRFAAWGLRLNDLHWEKRRYSGLGSYGSAKLAQLLSMLVFDQEFSNSGVTINTMHPGAVKSDTGQENGPLYRWFKRTFFDKTLKPASISAEALYYLGVSEEVAGVSGKFFNLTTPEEPAPPALDRQVAAELWELTLKMTGLAKSPEPDNKGKQTVNKAYDTIVVGAGAAGLTTAAFLAKAGQKVLLIEKNRELGGLVNTFVRNGFHFDAGVRALEDAGIILPMLKDLNIELEAVRSPVSLGVENEILSIENTESLVAYSAMLKKLYPENSGEIDEVIGTIRKIMKYMEVLYGIENPVFKDLKRDTNFIFKKLLPWMPRFMLTVGKINKMKLPVEDYLLSVVSNPSLRDIISQHFFRNTPTFFALSYFSLYLDYFYPPGGVGRLSEALGAKIRELGGVIINRTTVQRVDTENKFVVDDKGIHYAYKNLVWAGDLKTLYRSTETGNLLPEQGKQMEKVLRNKGGESVFTLYLQVDVPVEEFGRIANGHFFYTPSRRGLGETHRREFDELMSRFDSIDKQEVYDWLTRLVGLNTFEISIPALRDKSMAPAGKTGIIISFLAEHALFKKVQQAGWLDELITTLEEEIIRVITRSVYPMLEGNILHRFSFSPLSIENRTGSSEGAIVGWEFNADMPVINDIRIADRSVFTPFPGVYQAGQWAYSPAGVPMSILTGKLAADAILKNKKTS